MSNKFKIVYGVEIPWNLEFITEYLTVRDNHYKYMKESKFPLEIIPNFKNKSIIIGIEKTEMWFDVEMNDLEIAENKEYIKKEFTDIFKDDFNHYVNSTDQKYKFMCFEEP